MIVREYKKSNLERISKVHVDAWNTTYAGIIPQEYLQSRTYEEQQEKWRKRLFENKYTKEFMFVLENEDKPCKFYEHLGGKKVGEKVIDIYGTELIEVEYLWENIEEFQK